MAKAKPKAQTKRKRTPPSPKVLEQRRLTRLVRNMFNYMGFQYIKTEGKNTKFGLKEGELDHVFIHENIIIIVEETTESNPFNHAKNKKLFAEQLLSKPSDFIGWLKDNFPDNRDSLSLYNSKRYKLFYLYISTQDMHLDADKRELLEPMIVVSPRALSYFSKLARTIRKSAKTDLWRFLKLESKDIGSVRTGSDVNTIDTTIISPDDSTGFTNRVRLVSFMISAETLLRNAYVLRKDNWEFSTDLYQRLIDSNRINKIREYVAKDDSAFMNNIILGLPRDVSFQTSDGEAIDLDDVQDFTAHRMTIPDEFNSLCIIDGQHRVFAHYEGTDALEDKVAATRRKVHLLATGLIFPADMDELEKLKLQSEVFLSINSNSRPVPADVLLAIQALRDPYADVAIARRVLEDLNSRGTFRGLFQLSQMDNAPIKIASIVKFALRYLVDIQSDESLYSYWIDQHPEREELRKCSNSLLLAEYIDYCARILDIYFGALKKSFQDSWNGDDSKVRSTTVINGMIIALRKSLPAVGILDFRSYCNLMEAWNIDFSKKKFRYASSQYAMLSAEVLNKMFKLTESDGTWSQKTT